jgi:hypothetical protein
MRKLNEIIQRNAKVELDAARKKAQESGLVLTDRLFAERMARFFPKLSLDSVKKGFDRYYHYGHIWRVDYLEAFAQSLFRDASWMVVPHTAHNVKEATSTQLLWTAIGSRMSTKETHATIAIVHRLMDNPERYKLSREIAEVLLESRDANEASLKILDLVRASKVWRRKPRDLRGKKKNPKSRK